MFSPDFISNILDSQLLYIKNQTNADDLIDDLAESIELVLGADCDLRGYLVEIEYNGFRLPII